MKVKRIGLTAQMLVVISLFLLVVNSVQGYILVNQSKAAMKSQIRERMLDISNTAAAMLDGDAIAALMPGDEDTEDYRALMDVMALFRDHMDLEYIYVVRHVEGQLFTFIADSDLIAPAYFGEQVAYTDALYRSSLGVADVDSNPYQDRWGRFYSSYSPVFDSNGKVAAIVGVDFSAEWFDNQVAQHTRTILIFDAIALVLGALIILLIGSRINHSFLALNEEMNDLGRDVEDLTHEVAHSLGIGETEPHAAQDADAGRPNSEIGELGDKIRVMQQSLREYVTYMRSQAYMDVMTGLGNKAAYLDYVATLEPESGKFVPDYSVAVFDVNGLKNVNDDLGHEYGDRVIIDAAAVIKRAFGTEHVYRVGGDEFAAVLPGLSLEDVKTRFAAMDRDLAAFNSGETLYARPLAFSKGAAAYQRGQDSTYKEVFQRADEAMYADKAAYYASHGDRRRRNRGAPQA